MPRLRRIFIPDISVHVIQRGNNRMDIFREHGDHRSFLAFLRWAAAQYRVAIHAFVLMSNHFHLIVTPADAEGLPKTMQELGRRYVRYFNGKYDRIGTLLERSLSRIPDWRRAVLAHLPQICRA